MADKVTEILERFTVLAQQEKQLSGDADRIYQEYTDYLKSCDDDLNKKIEEIHEKMSKLDYYLDYAKEHAQASELEPAPGPFETTLGQLESLRQTIKLESHNDPNAESLYTKVTGQKLFYEQKIEEVRHLIDGSKGQAKRQYDSDIAALDRRKESHDDDIRAYIYSDEFKEYLKLLTFDKSAFNSTGTAKIPENRTVSLGQRRVKLSVPMDIEQDLAFLSNNEYNISARTIGAPFRVSLMSGSVIYLDFDERNKQYLLGGIQRLMLNSVKYFGHNIENMLFCEPENCTHTCLGNIAALARGEYPMVIIPDSANDIERKFTEYCEQIECNPTPDKVSRIVVLHSFPESYSQNVRERMLHLCKNAERYGVLVVLTHNSSAVETDLGHEIREMGISMRSKNGGFWVERLRESFFWYSTPSGIPEEIVREYVTNRVRKPAPQPVAEPVPQIIDEPVEPTFEPVEELAPIEQPVEPTFEPVDELAPIEQPVEPTFEPVEELAPIDEPVEPTFEPVDELVPIDEPVEPTFEPVDELVPIDEPVEPTFEPVEELAPIDEPVELTFEPVDELAPTEQPVEPTFEPTEELAPIEQPVEPTFEPVDELPPIEQPVEPTFEPVEEFSPIEQPVEPTFEQAEELAPIDEPVEPTFEQADELAPIDEPVEPTFEQAEELPPIEQPVEPTQEESKQENIPAHILFRNQPKEPEKEFTITPIVELHEKLPPVENDSPSNHAEQPAAESVGEQKTEAEKPKSEKAEEPHHTNFSQKCTRKLPEIALGLDVNEDPVSFSISGNVTYICGKQGAERRRITDAILSTVTCTCHPDDAELWMFDCGSEDLMRYANNPAAHIKYLVADNSPETAFDLIDALENEQTRRAELFSANRWSSISAVPSGEYLPQIIVIINDFPRLFANIESAPKYFGRNYSDKAKNLFKRCAEYGIHFLLIGETFSVNGRRPSCFEGVILHSAAVAGCDDGVKLMFSSLKLYENEINSLQRIPENCAFVAEENSTDGLTLVRFTGKLPVYDKNYRAASEYSKNTAEYVDKHGIIGDRREAVAYDERSDIRAKLIAGRADDEMLLFLGEPCRFASQYPVHLCRDFGENILAVIPRREQHSGIAVISAALRSLEEQGFPAEIIASRSNPTYSALAAIGFPENVNVFEGEAAINRIREIGADVVNGNASERVVIVLGGDLILAAMHAEDNVADLKNALVKGSRVGVHFIFVTNSVAQMSPGFLSLFRHRVVMSCPQSDAEKVLRDPNCSLPENAFRLSDDYDELTIIPYIM